MGFSEWIRYKWLKFNWRRRAKKRRRPAFFVGDLRRFFGELNSSGVRYAVLRWFEELPLDLKSEASFDGDLDLMVDSRDFDLFGHAVARCPGKIKIDLYSEGIRGETGYKRLPYYAPLLAREILDNTVMYSDSFKRPDDARYLRSLCYHLVYHKGQEAGLPSGLEQMEYASNRHPVEQALRGLAAATGETLPHELTLLGLHEWLAERLWDMPYDMLVRWGKRNIWHDMLQKHIESQLTAKLGGLHDILVFLLREDAYDMGASEFIIEELKGKFTLLEVVELDSTAQARVLRHTRGGDWTKHKELQVVLPVTAVICHDPAPVEPAEDSVLAKIHRGVRNANVFFKHELRKKLESMYPEAAANFLHGSDNDYESIAYVEAVFGSEVLPLKREEYLGVLGRQ